jgi:hypothetical protein
MKAFAVEFFIWSNLAFLGADIGLAHAENSYAHVEEWIPLFFSAAAALVLLPALASARVRQKLRWPAIFVGGAAMCVGVGGMIYHLSSVFFERQTLANLVYAAPFVAPLAYVGVGLLLLLTRLEPPSVWGDWILLLALGGFAGNLGLSLLDHAQNGFARWTEWIPVAAAAYACGFLLMTLLRPADTRLARATVAVLVVQIAVGGAGFVLHLAGDAERPGAWIDRLLHGAPPFAPLLFADLALLGALGLWTRRET